jgi:hypothetical protein
MRIPREHIRVRRVVRDAAISILLVFFLATPPFPCHAADLFLVGERDLYLAIDKLDAMGALPGFLANRRPYSVAAVRAALDNNLSTAEVGAFDANLARWVSLAIKDSLMVRGSVAVGASEKREIWDDQDGVPTPKGVSTRLSAMARETTSQYVSGQASGSWFYGKDGDYGFRLGPTSLEVGVPYASLQIGKLTTWYGPGRRGALIYTNNAQPYPGIRLHNPVPIPVPGLFSFLGNVQYDWFFARLSGSDRPINNTILSGIRLAARPSRFFELGASRAIQYGGDGQDDSLSTYWKILTGQRESEGNTPTGNSLASLDASIHLPFRVQPFEIYGEWGGEDQSRAFVYTRHAWLAGVFLPSIGPIREADFRAEYGTTLTNEPNVWYQHADYPHEYRGQILGHPMGTDAKDLFFQGHYYLVPSSYIELTWIRTDRYGTDEPKETTDRFAAGIVGWVTEKVRVEAQVALENVKNPGNMAGPPSSDGSIWAGVSYQIGRTRPLEMR